MVNGHRQLEELGAILYELYVHIVRLTPGSSSSSGGLESPIILIDP